MSSLTYIRQLRHNFTVRVIFILVVTMVTLAGIFDYFLINMQKKSFEADMIRNGLADVTLLAQTTRFAVFAENEQDLLPLIEGFLEREDVAEVILLNGLAEVIARKQHENLTMTLFDSLADILRIAQNSQTNSHMFMQKEDIFIFYSPVYFTSAQTSDEALFLGQYDVELKKEIIGHAALVMKSDMYQQRVSQILLRTGWFVFLFLVIGVFVAVLIIRKVTKPIHNLLSKVRQGGVGSNQQDDINLLSETYSNLIDNLSASFATIQGLKEDLEKRVEERTAELVDRQNKLEQANVRLADTIKTLHETQNQLIQSEKLASIGQLVAGVAHEMNNTINFISAALPSLNRSLNDVKRVVEDYDNLEGKTSSDEIEKEFQVIRAKKQEVEFADLFATIDQLLANIGEGTSRTATIINDLRIYSRKDLEKMQPVDLHALIESSLPFVDKKLSQGVEIKKDFGHIDLVDCLPGRISQVFLNILINGMQAMNGHGFITIKSWQDEEYVHVSFADAGCGIAPEIRGKIFDPFFTSKDVGQGCGLGLGISYEIIKQHGGQLNVESEQGKGAVFEVVLPLPSKKRSVRTKQEEETWKN